MSLHNKMKERAGSRDEALAEAARMKAKIEAGTSRIPATPEVMQAVKEAIDYGIWKAKAEAIQTCLAKIAEGIREERSQWCGLTECGNCVETEDAKCREVCHIKETYPTNTQLDALLKEGE